MGKLILILDDDRDLLDVLQEVLVYEGYEPVMVEGTDDLLELVRRYQPSLVLLDFSLNGRNGGWWCHQLKKDPELKAIPVIIFTAYSDKGIAKGAYGCDDYLAKPFDLYDLIRRIRVFTQDKVRFDIEPALLPPVADVAALKQNTVHLIEKIKWSAINETINKIYTRIAGIRIIKKAWQVHRA